jgi:hypothetical protein
MKPSKTSIVSLSLTLSVLALAICSASVAAETERVISCEDIAPINKMLAEGWTVKHQAVATAPSGSGYGFSSKTIYLFTLAAPPPEVIAENEARRKADFERRRAEYIAKQRNPDKP